MTGRADRLAEMRLPLLAALLILPACGGVSLIIKDPIVEKCTSAGIQGCPDLTDGVVLFVEGNQDEGKSKVLHGTAANSPEQLREFATILQLVGKIPGATGYMGPVLEVAKIILDEAKKKPEGKGKKPLEGEIVAEGRERELKPAPPIVPQGLPGPDRFLTADTDMDRLVSGIAAPALSPSHVSCASPIDLATAWCITAAKGPFVVTDLRAGPGCLADIFASAGDAGARSWSLAGSPLAPLTVHGGRLLVRTGEALVLGAGGKGAGESRCTVVWAGFKPYRPPGGPRDVVE